MPPKYLTLTEKSKILEELNKGQSVTMLAKQYGVAKSTICSIRNKQKLILKAVSNTHHGLSKRRTLKCAEFPEMEQLLYKWLLEQCDEQVPINSQILKEKAKCLHEELQENNNKFIASDGWLQRFKVRYGVRHLRMSRSPRSECASPFSSELNAKIKELQLSSDQIYRANETGLYWKLLPEKMYMSKPERQRVTILACTNATGTHKVNPLVIGKARLTNLNCPVHYRNSKSACMTEAIFNEWFHELFIPEVKSYMEAHGLPVKALLILDNSLSRSSVDEVRSRDGCIVAIYTPPLLQPMEQNVAAITKLYYRKSLLSLLISKNYENVVEAMQQLSLKEAVFNLALAWDNLKPGTIRKCWQNILSKHSKRKPAEVENEDDLEETVSEVVTLVNHISPELECSKIDINNWNEDRIPDDIQYSDSDDECITEEDGVVSSKEAIELCNQLLNWAQKNNADYSDILVLQKLREKAVVINLTKNDDQQKLYIPFQTVFVTITENMSEQE